MLPNHRSPMNIDSRNASFFFETSHENEYFVSKVFLDFLSRLGQEENKFMQYADVDGGWKVPVEVRPGKYGNGVFSSAQSVVS